MHRKTHTTRRMLQAFVVVASVAAIAVPTAIAGVDDPGVAARQLGSQDSRDTAGKALFLPGMVASRLGSQGSRETANEIPVASSIVAAHAGTPDSRDALQQVADQSLTGDYMFRDYFRNAGSPKATPEASPVTVSNGGLDWGTVGIGIGAALGGMLLLGALVVGVVEIRHTKRPLGSA